ncbi:MAG: IS1595 family transposase [Pseudomonadota bacterium]|jgi:transposase-like protein|nr:IS1595 family transposase [Pseudomonadota bacterium]
MDKKDLDQLTEGLGELTYPQLKRIRGIIESLISSNQTGKAIADREQEISQCPHCEHEHFVKHGTTARGQQRYKCKNPDCKRTFNSLTGTPLERMRMPDKWHQYSQGMWLTNKIRDAAKELGINVKTAWAWRHRMLANPSLNKPSELHGIIEADETFLPESFKGSKQMPREPRKRGGGDSPKVPIFLALDRNGAVTHRVLERNTIEQLKLALTPVVTPESVLCTDGNLSYKRIVKDLPFEIDHKRLIALDNERVIDGVYHIQTLNNWMMRWKQWLKQFYGVGTAFVDHYLSWFRQMDGTDRDESWVVMAL